MQAAHAQEFVYVYVPPGTATGTYIQHVLVNGNEVSVQVPEGADTSSGFTLNVAVPPVNDHISIPVDDDFDSDGARNPDGDGAGNERDNNFDDEDMERLQVKVIILKAFGFISFLAGIVLIILEKDKKQKGRLIIALVLDVILSMFIFCRGVSTLGVLTDDAGDRVANEVSFSACFMNLLFLILPIALWLTFVTIAAQTIDDTVDFIVCWIDIFTEAVVVHVYYRRFWSNFKLTPEYLSFRELHICLQLFYLILFPWTFFIGVLAGACYCVFFSKETTFPINSLSCGTEHTFVAGYCLLIGSFNIVFYFLSLFGVFGYFSDLATIVETVSLL